jgi:hypothetical protein
MRLVTHRDCPSLTSLSSILLMAFTVSLEGQVTYSLAAFAVSSFSKHSLLSTVYVVQGVVNGSPGLLFPVLVIR